MDTVRTHQRNLSEAPPTRLRRSYRCRLALCEEAVCQPKRPRCSLTLPAASLLGNLFRSTVLGVTSILDADGPTSNQASPLCHRLRPSLVSKRYRRNAQSQLNASGQLLSTYKSQLHPTAAPPCQEPVPRWKSHPDRHPGATGRRVLPAVTVASLQTCN
ncbi:hypothetical protein BC567DRAFT_68436 [Phyllosticta citribraziliensis]